MVDKVLLRDNDGSHFSKALLGSTICNSRGLGGEKSGTAACTAAAAAAAAAAGSVPEIGGTMI